jgi:hypothetical protein
LSQEAIEKGRVERRRGYAEERERTAAGLVGSEVTGKPVSRKGTIFGKRKKAVEI